MGNYFTDNDDLRFYFDRGIDWAPVIELTENRFGAGDGFKSTTEALEFYREIATSVGELAADRIAPHAAAVDREGAHLVDGEAVQGPAMAAAFGAIKDAELHKLCLPRELGGLNAPLLMYFANTEILGRADVSVMAHHSFHGGMAMAMLALSATEGTTEFDAAGRIVRTRFGAQIADIAEGGAWGCMDITEPNAGSDMAALRTRAVMGSDGIWRLTGQKIFITSGHGKYHFVIARTEEAASGDDPFAGLAGLSMFLVKAYEDRPDGTRERYVSIDRVEEKLGHHGSVTASLSFENTPAELLGKRGEGFRYMLVLMNNARLGVGFESIGIAEAALRMASAYASERHTMGKPVARHEIIADYLDEMQTDIQGLRALAFAGAWHEEIAQKLQLRGRAESSKRELTRHRRIARRYTPLLKYLAAEKAVEISRRNLQIHGGVGYTRDYGAERLLRDAVVMPIYEGTSQIQSLMAMKDTLGGIVKQPQRFLSRVTDAHWRARTAGNSLDKRVARIQSLSLAAQQFLITRTAAGKLRALGDVPVTAWRTALTTGWDPKRDFALAMLHAERLTRLLADEVICEVLWEQSRAHPDRRELLERYLERAEVRARALHDEITTTGTRMLARLEGA